MVVDDEHALFRAGGLLVHGRTPGAVATLTPSLSRSRKRVPRNGG